MNIAKLKPTGWLRIALLAFYYAAIIVTIIVLQARNSFATPSFIYQGF